MAKEELKKIDTMRALDTIKSERKMLIETGQMSDWRLHHIDRLIDIYEEQLENSKLTNK